MQQLTTHMFGQFMLFKFCQAKADDVPTESHD